MRPIGQWAHMMSTTVQVAAASGPGDYGQQTYASPVTYQAHLSKGARYELTAPIADLVDSISIYINGAPPVIATAQVTLSTADVGSTEAYERQPRLLAVSRRFDQRGGHHTVLYCGWITRAKSA